MKKVYLLICAIYISFFARPVFSTTPYTDRLAICIVESTSTKDRNMLIKWVFTSMAQHPTIKQRITLPGWMASEYSYHAAKIMERLLVSDCRQETVQSVKYEGGVAIENSFGFLGQVAMQELFKHPDVAQALTDLENNFDIKKLDEALK